MNITANTTYKTKSKPDSQAGRGKDFGICVPKGKRQFAPLLFIARPLCTIPK